MYVFVFTLKCNSLEREQKKNGFHIKVLKYAMKNITFKYHKKQMHKKILFFDNIISF